MRSVIVIQKLEKQLTIDKMDLELQKGKKSVRLWFPSYTYSVHTASNVWQVEHLYISRGDGAAQMSQDIYGVPKFLSLFCH